MSSVAQWPDTVLCQRGTDRDRDRKYVFTHTEEVDDIMAAPKGTRLEPNGRTIREGGTVLAVPL